MPDYSNIIQSIITEKSSRQQETGRYTFAVKRTASKEAIKKALNAIFNIEVEEVKTLLMPKKTRLLGQRRLWVKRPVFKKAIVKIKNGKTLDPNKISFPKPKS